MQQNKTNHPIKLHNPHQKAHCPLILYTKATYFRLLLHPESVDKELFDEDCAVL
jgi:hypothetical protein